MSKRIMATLEDDGSVNTDIQAGLSHSDVAWLIKCLETDLLSKMLRAVQPQIEEEEQNAQSDNAHVS